MLCELYLTPQGHLRCTEQPESAGNQKNLELARISSADLPADFSQGTGEGLFSLYSIDSKELSPVFLFWKNFTRRFLQTLAGSAANAEGAALAPEALDEMLLGIPPMRGAEYLTRQVILGLWSELESRAAAQIGSKADGLDQFLDKWLPNRHRLGRVCLHLAENKNDFDRPFAFMATYASETGKNGAAGKTMRFVPLSRALNEYAGTRNKGALLHLLSPIQLASEKSTLMRELTDTGDIYHAVAWTQDKAYRFLQEIPLYEECGLITRLPNWWRKRSRPQVQVSIGSEIKTKTGLPSLLDFSISVVVDGNRLAEDEIRELLNSQEKLVQFKGQWIEVDREKLTEALDLWKKVAEDHGEGVSFIEGMRLLAGASADLKINTDQEELREWAFVSPGEGIREILDGLRNPENLADTLPGRELKARLRDYQQTGLNWLRQLSTLGLGACLADDMGLGKTIQIIALMLLRKKKPMGRSVPPNKSSPSLLVLPASLINNWKKEIERFAPSLKALYLHSSLLAKDDFTTLEGNYKTALPGVDVVLTSYGMVSRLPWLEEISWDLIVLDEAQNIKNPGTRQSKAVKKLKGFSRIALTGTPVENRAGDLWSLFDFLAPGLLGTSGRFSEFLKQLSNHGGEQYAPLRKLVQPYILRRLKTDKNIIRDLPDKTEVQTFCSLTKKQIVLYQQSVDELKSILENTEISNINRKGLVLSYLTRFKQICNHPSQLTGDGLYNPSHSGKFERISLLCEEIFARQEKVLIFTQYREIIEPLADFLCMNFQITGQILHGGTAVKKRQVIVDEFQSENGPPFLVLSLKAGGTGLNLTAASHVIHFDRWWNPAVENQATDRAFRIGQKRNVMVHKFVCPGTIEEKIDQLITEKKSLADDLVEGGNEPALTEMTDDELLDLISIDVNRASF